MPLDNKTPVSFQENLIPSGSRLVGWAALVHSLSIKAPVRCPSCVSLKHVKGSHRKEGNWTIFDKRYWSGEDFIKFLQIYTPEVNSFHFVSKFLILYFYLLHLSGR